MEPKVQAEAVLDSLQKPPLTHRGHFLLSIFWLALNFQGGALIPVVVAAQVLLFVSERDKVVLFGLLSAVGTVVGLLTQPLIGALSDRTHLAWGRRHPYILLGTLFTLVGMAMMAGKEGLAVFVLGFLLVQIASNAATAAYQSLLPDQVPPNQRGTASGYMGVMSMLGTFGSLAAASYLFADVSEGPAQADQITHAAEAFYWLTGLLLLATMLLTILGVKEQPVERVPAHRRPFAAYWLAPLRVANFRWVFITRLLLMLGLWLFQTFIEYYLDDVLHLTNFIQATGLLGGLALIGAVASAFVGGWLSDVVGRVKIVCLASGLMAAATTVFVLAPSAIIIWPMAVVFGLGYGAYLSVDWALAVDTLPSLEEVGKDMGLWNIATNLPLVVAPLLGSAVITIFAAQGETPLGYRLVFALASLGFLLAVVFILKVREPRRASGQMA